MLKLALSAAHTPSLWASMTTSASSNSNVGLCTFYVAHFFIIELLGEINQACFQQFCEFAAAYPTLSI